MKERQLKRVKQYSKVLQRKPNSILNGVEEKVILKPIYLSGIAKTLHIRSPISIIFQILIIRRKEPIVITVIT